MPFRHDQHISVKFLEIPRFGVHVFVVKKGENFDYRHRTANMAGSEKADFIDGELADLLCFIC